MKKILYTAFYFCSALLLNSCIGDLDQYPHEDETSSTIYTNAENYKAVLGKIYAAMVTTGQEKGGDPDLSSNSGQDYMRCFFNLQECGTDEVASTWLSGDNVSGLTYLSWDANDPWVSDMYYRIYYNIALCNEFLRNATDEKLAEFNEQDQTEIRHYRAEARFMRALFYYHAMDLFRNIPFVTENDPTVGYLPPRYTSAQIFSYIESELNAITNDMLSKGDCPYGRASQGAAYTLLAKLYLNAEVYIETSKSQSFTFAASANPICYQGATPIFVDSEPDTWNMDPILLEQAICDRMKQTGLKPKAILPVHLYGTPARMNEICDIASRYGIPVVEDAAEAMGAVYNGRYCGTFGQYGIFSFNGNKMITTSGGGALLCHTEEEAQRVKFYATQAREPFPWYQHEQIGYNYRLSNVSAGIGRGQMRVVDNHIAHRRAIHRLYTELLAGLPGITVVEPKKSTIFLPNYWLTTIKVDSNETSFSALQLMQHLAKADIETRPLWKPLHLQPVFSSSPTYVNGVSEALFNCGLCLPSGSMMTCEDVMRVADAIRSMR